MTWQLALVLALILLAAAAVVRRRRARSEAPAAAAEVPPLEQEWTAANLARTGARAFAERTRVSSTVRPLSERQPAPVTPPRPAERTRDDD